MTTEDDIAFLEAFRSSIERFLIVGTAPTMDRLWGGSGLIKMEEAMKDPEFRDLRRTINQAKGRAAQILESLGIGCTFHQHPPPAVGGPTEKFPLFDLITDNRSHHTIDGTAFTDKLDEAIGLLRNSATRSETTARTVFVTLGESTQDVRNAVEAAVKTHGFSTVIAETQFDPTAGEPPEALRQAACIVADLGGGGPAIFWQAGFAQALDKPVIGIAHFETLSAADSRSLLVFRNPIDLRQKLTRRLENTLARKTA
jgi:hypothetical protein